MGKIVEFKQVQKQAKPSLQELVARIRDLVKDNFDCVGFDHPHIQERMVQRGKGMREVLETIRNGEGIKGPDLDVHGDYRIKLRRHVCGKTTQIVVAVREKDLTVITVF